MKYRVTTIESGEPCCETVSADAISFGPTGDLLLVASNRLTTGPGQGQGEGRIVAVFQRDRLISCVEVPK